MTTFVRLDTSTNTTQRGVSARPQLRAVWRPAIDAGRVTMRMRWTIRPYSDTAKAVAA